MSCYCHRIHQTCSYCEAQFEELPPGEVVATTLIDHNGNAVETFLPHSDPDGRPHHLFGNKVIKDTKDAFDKLNASVAHKSNLAHRIPFAWNWHSIRDDLRLGTVALILPTTKIDNP